MDKRSITTIAIAISSIALFTPVASADCANGVGCVVNVSEVKKPKVEYGTVRKKVDLGDIVKEKRKHTLVTTYHKRSSKIKAVKKDNATKK